ncbi:MAG: hypothetical protein WC533_04110 [Candidatus Pacearchaeota archaeon]
MKIIGFNYDKVYAKKDKEISKDVKIITNIDILELQKKQDNFFKNGDLFELKYNFTIDYSPKIAKINFEGVVIILIDDKTLSEKIEEKWIDKLLIEDIRIPLFNLIFSKLNVKAMELEEDIGIPTHIPSPRVVPVSNDPNKEEDKGKNKKDKVRNNKED